MIRFAKKLRNYFLLAKQNGVMNFLSYFANHNRGLRKTYKFEIDDESLHIRSSTPDLKVARSCLDGEFGALRGLFDPNARGLIIDAGGYIGTAAIALAKLYPHATVVTIEPSAENFEILSANISAHKNIYAERAALVPNSGFGSISLNNRGTGNWGFTVVESPKDRPATFLEEVSTISVDDILRKYGFDRVLIFKMDIEGGEYQMLKHPQWLDKTEVLIIELHDRIVVGCKDLFVQSNAGRDVRKDDGEKYLSMRRAGA